ncbi:unnamed protein product [Cunninghamella blakesleeana]
MYSFFILLSFLFIIIHQVIASSDIDECTKLSDTSNPLDINVHRLHPKNIKVIASIGDSITAGLAAKNTNDDYLTKDSFIEYRGLSWLSGGDNEATSIANYIKYYSSDLFGSSKGEKRLELCKDTFFCTSYSHNFETDQLNAALSASTSYSIKDQVEYLIKYIGKGTEHDDKWKLINIFIGTNDIAVSCKAGFDPNTFEKNIREGLELLRTSVNKVLIQLIPLVHIEEIPEKSKTTPNYQKLYEGNVNVQKYECLCCQKQQQQQKSLLPIRRRRRGLFNPKTSSETSPETSSETKYLNIQVEKYNQRLIDIAKDYSKGGRFSNDQFTVIHQSFSIDMSSLPITALSNVDAYHPNTNAYKFFSKALWNQMFVSQIEKQTNFEYDDNLKLKCLSETDYIRTD